MRNVLAHAGRQGRRIVSGEAARAQWRRVAEELRPKLPKLAVISHDTQCIGLPPRAPMRPADRVSSIPCDLLAGLARLLHGILQSLEPGSNN